MREPFELLLGPYRDHPFIGPYLHGPDPDWHGLATDEKVSYCSSGEKLMLRVAAAFAGRDHDVAIAELGILDATHRMRVAQAIIWTAREGI